jgi:hypothetical protein
MKSRVLGSTRGAASMARSTRDEDEAAARGGASERGGRRRGGAAAAGGSARRGGGWEWRLGLERIGERSANGDWVGVGPSFCLLVQLGWWGQLHTSGRASGHASGKSPAL